MGLFEDKKIQSLDWLSLAIEPMTSSLNEYIKNVPDELLFDLETLTHLIEKHYSLCLSLKQIIAYVLHKYNSELSNHVKLNSLEYELLSNNGYFELKIIGEPIVDFKNNSISNGSIKLIKQKSILDEKDLKYLLGLISIVDVKKIHGASKDAHSRLNKILEILDDDCEQYIKTKSISKKINAIASKLLDIFQNNKWNIKDVDLSNKIGSWIAAYVDGANQAALTNLYKLKIMTYSGQPIYSIQETV